MTPTSTPERTAVIEAPSADEALAEVHRRFGESAQIVGAEKVLRGGVGGFFARELVQLRVRPPESGAIARTLADIDAQEETFGEALRRRLAPPLAPDCVVTSAGIPAEPTTQSVPGPAWGARNLARLGIPAQFVSEEPGDDLAWIRALADAVAPLCRPLPAGPSVLIGPRAARLADRLGLAVVRPGEQARTAGDFCAPVRDTPRDRGWLAWTRERRWLHLVVGGAGWRWLLFDDPLAVSWAEPEMIGEALHLAADLGLVLGYTPAGRRATPVDVALAVRDLLPRA